MSYAPEEHVQRRACHVLMWQTIDSHMLQSWDSVERFELPQTIQLTAPGRDWATGLGMADRIAPVPTTGSMVPITSGSTSSLETNDGLAAPRRRPVYNGFCCI